MNLWTIFITGLFTGGLTCLAVQGGLLATTIAQREEERLKEKTRTGNALPIFSFVVAKIIAYTLLGFLLGWFGSVFELSLTAKIIMQLLVGIFMIGTAFSLLDVHPVFRYFLIQPPKFLTRLIRNQMSRPKADQPLAEKSSDFFAPAILGAFTVLIPCGTTQAMMALAIATGNPLLGAITLFIFTLGTSPIFFVLGYFATKLGMAIQQKFLKIAAFSIILIATLNLNGAIALTGSRFTIENIWAEAYCTIFTFCNNKVLAAQTQITNVATINIESNGYSPKNLSVKAGSPVTLHLVNQNAGGCTQVFTIPSLGIQKIITRGNSDTIQFTAPRKAGKLAFMCSMGMYRGEIEVI